jgi:hypothetical protein
MAQADPLSNPVRVLITGAHARPSTIPIRAVEGKSTFPVENPPSLIQRCANSTDREYRADDPNLSEASTSNMTARIA